MIESAGPVVRPGDVGLRVGGEGLELGRPHRRLEGFREAAGEGEHEAQPRVRGRGRWGEPDRLPRLGFLSFDVPAEVVLDQGEGDVDVGGLRLELPRLLRRRPRLRERVERRDSAVEAVDAVGVREARVGVRVARVPGERALEFGDRLRSLPPVEVITPLQVIVVGLDIAGSARGEAGFFGRQQPHFQGVGDRARDLVLDLEDVFHLAVVALRPEMVAVGHVDQLRADPDPLAGLAHAPFEHALNVERAADPPDVFVLPLEREGGGAGSDAEGLDLGQRVDDLFRHAVAEILVFLFGGEVTEGEHRDRFSRGASGSGCHAGA